MKEDIDWSQEFSNPDANFLILLQEMETEIKLMQLDLLQIQSPILKGYAQEKYLDFKERYFYLLAKDLHLLKMYEKDNAQKLQSEEDDFEPM